MKFYLNIPKSFLCVFLLFGVAKASVVSVNLYTNSGGQLSSSLETGAFAAENWNNVDHAGTPFGDDENVLDSQGNIVTGGLVFSWDQTGNANDTGSSLNLFNQGVFRNGTVNLTINTGTSVFKQNPFDLYIYATTPANNVSGEGTSITAGGGRRCMFVATKM